MRRIWRTIGLAALLALSATSISHAQSVPGALLLYPNYRGLVFSDRPEIVVEAPSGTSVVVTDTATGSTVGTAQSTGTPVHISSQTLTQDRDYTVTATQSGSVLGRWTVTPVPASRRASMNISFDPKGRLLMHGTPRFGLGVYDSGLGYTTDPAAWEDMLFAPGGKRELGDIPLNLYLNYWYGNAPTSAMLPLMDTLQKHGIMYFQTGNCFAQGSYTRTSFAIDQSDTYVTQFGAHPGAAGYYIADECVDALIPETVTHHTRLAGLDKDSATLAVTLAHGYIDPRKWIGAADLLGSDPYTLYGKEPAQGYAHFNVADYIAHLNDAQHGSRPVIAVLQFFKFTTDSRFPTAAEQRSHAIMSIVEGAKGIFWWEIGSNGLRKSDAATVATQMGNLKSLVTELASLEPALIADDQDGALTGNSTRYADPIAGRKEQLTWAIATDWLFSNKTWYKDELARLNAGDASLSPMAVGAATIRTKTKIVDGKGYVFAYNYTNQSTPVTFTWHNAPGTVTEHKSGTTYPVSGSSWTDTFGAYESRVYVIANGGAASGPPDPPPPPPSTGLTVSFTNPTAAATVSGTTTVSVAATGGSTYGYTVTLDGTQTLYSGTNPSFSWNTTTASNGSHTLATVVTDGSGKTGTTSESLTVANGTPPPPPPPPPPPTAGFTAAFSQPQASAIATRLISIGVSTTATWGKSKTFTIYVDSTQISTATLTGTTQWITWNPATVANGPHTLKVTVTYNGQTASATRAITVQNGTTVTPPPPPPPPPGASFTAAFSYPQASASVKGSTSIGVSTTATWGQSKTIKIYVDSTQISSVTVPGTTQWITWNSAAVANGSHTLKVVVTYNGQTATATRAITVNN